MARVNRLILLGKHHLIMYNVPDSDYPLVCSNSSYPIIIDVMSYKGQKDYKSCKVQSHTTAPLLKQRKGEFTGCNTFNQNK